MRRIVATLAIGAVAAGAAAGTALAGYGSPPARSPDPKAPSLAGAAKVSLLQGIEQAGKVGTVIEAKYEPDDSGKASLSTYAAKGFGSFFEVSGDPSAAAWKPGRDAITAREDLVSSAVDLTILDEGRLGLAGAVRKAMTMQQGTPYWAVPTLQGGKPGVGVWIADSDGKPHRVFVPLA